MATAYDFSSSSSSDDNLSVSSGLLDFLEDPNLSIDTTRSSVLDFGLDFDLYVLIWQQSMQKNCEPKKEDFKITFSKLTQDFSASLLFFNNLDVTAFPTLRLQSLANTFTKQA